MNDQNLPQDPNSPASYVDDYQPPQSPQSDQASMAQDDNPAPVVPQPQTQGDQPMVDMTSEQGDEQSLESQNIFFLLGVEDVSDDEKESFLDELQQVIWEDFLDNDVELLLTEEETSELKKIMAKEGMEEEALQEEIVVYLEKLIPDLEEIMLEKALELKEDMVRERIAGMKEYYAQRPEDMSKIDQAEQLMNSDKWKEAAELLNTVKP